MESLNGNFTYLQHVDSKKDSLRKAILTLAVEWKDLDEHLDSTKDCFHSCVIDLELKQKDLEYNQESVSRSFKELDEVRESLDLRLEKLERREERFYCFQKAQVEELGRKEKQLGEIRVWIEEKMGECEMREEKLFVQKKSMEMLLQNIEREKEEFEVIQKSVDEKLMEVHFKERKYESLCKEVSSIKDRMETWAKELDSKEEQLKELQKLNEERRNELDIIAGECELKEEWLSVEKKSMEVKLEEFDMEKEEFEKSKKSVDEKWIAITSKERNCESLFTEVNLIQDWTKRRSRELYSKEEEFTLREEQLNVRQKLNEDLREELDVISQEYKLKEKNLEIEKKEFQNIKELVDKKWNKIRLKEKNYEDQCAEAKSTLDQIERRARELDSREEQVALREEQLQAMRKMNKKCCQELNAIEKDCKLREERLSVERKSIEKKLGKIEKETEQFEVSKKTFTDKFNEISLKERTLEDRSKELNLIQGWIERRARELDLGEEQFALREEQLRMEKKSMEVLLEKIEKEKEDIEDSKKSIAEKLNEISLKEINYENLAKEVKLMLDGIESRATELDSKEELVAFSEEQLKAKLNKERCEEVDIIVPECKLKKEKLNMERKSMKVLFETIEKEKKQFEDCKKSVGDMLIEISGKQKNCEHLSKEVNLILGQIERRAREFDSKDEQFVLREEQLMAMKKLKKERCEDLFVLVQECKFIEERITVTKKSMEVVLEVIEKEKETGDITQVCNLKEEMLCVANNSIMVLLEKFEKLKEEFEEIQNSVGIKLNEFSLKERNYEDLSKDVKFILNRIERQAKKIDSEVEKLSLSKEQLKPAQIFNGERGQELEIVLQELDSVKRPSSTHAENFDLKQKQLDSAQEHINHCFGDFHLKTNQFSADQKLFEERCKELESKEKLLEERLKDFESRVEKFKDRSKDVKLKEKQLKEMPKEHLWKEKQFDNVKAKQVEEMPTMNLPKEIPDISTLDGRGLQLYVSEHHRDRSFSKNKLCEILQSSSDPANLVIGAMEGFYPPHLKKGDVEFETGVTRRFCIILLEQLMMLSPQIGPHVRKVAFILAGEWKVKMEVHKEQLEILGFIQLVASYKLASDFDADQLLEHFEFFAMRRRAPELCRALDLSEKVPDLITSLVRNNKHWVAVKFIVEFELVEKFPPVPLLKDYLRVSNKLIRYKCFKDYKTPEALDIAMDERIACLRNIMNCIKSHKLECGKWYFKIEHMLRNFRDQKVRKLTDPASVVKDTVQKHDDNNFVPYTTAHAPDRMSKKGFSYLLANMDVSNNIDQSAPEDLQLSNTATGASGSNSHSSWDGIPDTVRYASDPAQLVLDVVKSCYFSMLKNRKISKVEVMKSFNFLLSRLLRVPLEVKPHIKDQAKQFAADWKKKVKRHALEVSCLLLLLATFKVLSSFPTAELLSLLEIVYDDKMGNSFFQSLGLSEEIPDFIRGLIERGQHLGAIKYVYAFVLVDKISPFPILEDYIKGAKEEARKIREKAQDSLSARNNATELELNAYKAVMNCASLHRLEQYYPIQNLKTLIEQMEMQVFDKENINKKRKCGQDFVHNHQPNVPIEPSCSRKRRQRAALFKQKKPKISDTPFYPFQPLQPAYHHAPPAEFQVELQSYVPPIGDYFSGVPNSVSPYMNQSGPGSVPSGGYPPRGFRDCADFNGS